MRYVWLIILSILLASCGPGKSPGATITPTSSPSVTPTFIPTFTPTPTSSADLSLVDASAILFAHNFESDAPDGISFSLRYWTLANDDTGNRSLCSIPGDYYAGVNFGSSYWTNYAVELRVKELEHQGDGYVAIYARYDPAFNIGYYGALGFQPYGASLSLNEPYTSIGYQDYPTTANTWYIMRVELAGQKIKYYINNQLVGQGTDLTLAQGAANFSVSPNMKVCIDDIRVWALSDTGAIITAPTPDPTALAKAENNPDDIYPQVWSQISPTGQSYEYKVNCGSGYAILETCFLWNLDQVVVTTPSGAKFSLNKDFNQNAYSGEITRRWVLYGPNGAGLPENGEYTFTYLKNGETLFVQKVTYTQSILSIPTHVAMTQEGNGLHVTWQPPEGVATDMWYKVIIFNNATGQLAASQVFPSDSKDVVLPDLPLIPGTRYYMNVAIFSPTGYAYSENIIFTWVSP